MKRAFRILFLDDTAVPVAKLAIISKKECNFAAAKCSVIDEFLSGKPSPDVEVFLCKSAQMESVWKVPTEAELRSKTAEELKKERPLTEAAEVEDFLRTLDVIILDIGGVGPTRHQDEFMAAVASNFAQIGRQAPREQDRPAARRDGIEFFHIYLQTLSKNTLVVILTQHDADGDSVVDSYIHDFTVQDYNRESRKGSVVPELPYVVKFDKSSSDTDAWLKDLVLSHHDFFSSDLSDATNRFHISLAANHDQPVMIVGESGTGKEGVARFIHKQWARRKLRENPKLSKKVGRFQVINCGGLSEKLAQIELFGYLKGSFTGADEHRLGKVFIAAGIDPLSKSNSRERSAQINSETSADISELLDSFDDLDVAAANGDELHGANKSVRRALNNLFRPEGALNPAIKRLVVALHQAEEMIKDPLRLANTNGDFYNRLMANSDGLLKVPDEKSKYSESITDSSDYNLEYGLDHRIGTLFLDEFADLPLSVQTLLLRFLQSGEVQPLGFSGRILGLKVRIIVATSDSRVAEFAGTPVNDDFRTPEELKRPLRNDLLHRVRFQAIRTEPVTTDNVERILKGMIAQKPDVNWDDGAVNYLVNEIRKIIDPKNKPEPSATPGFNRRASFGHRRELSRVVDLVSEYAQSAGSRGVRDTDLEKLPDGSYLAKEGLIERLWSPAMIVAADPSTSFMPAEHLLVTDTPLDKERINRIRSKFVNALSNLPDPVTLPEEWQYKIHVLKNKKVREQATLLKEIIKSLFDDKANPELEVRHALTCSGIVANAESLNEARSFLRVPSAKK